LALTRRGGCRVVGVGRRAAPLARALRRRAVHEATTDTRRGVRDADIVVLCAPVDRIVPLAATIRPWLKKNALVMDIGSVKAPIVRKLEKIYARGGAAFVGTHPMAGSEKTGVENALPHLYKGATCVLTAGRGTPAAALRRAAAFWRSLGARAFEMNPEAHDDWMALVSHLPHLLAHGLLLTAMKRPGARAHVGRLAAGSFRDVTRVAAADPKQWASIFRMNQTALRRAAGGFAKALAGLSRRGWPPSELARSKAFREVIPGGKK